MWELTFEADTEELEAVLQKLTVKLSPPGLMGFLATMVDPWLRMRTDNRFASEGDDVTGNWHPLTLATQMMRIQGGFPPSHPINVRTGKMRDFLTGMASDVKPNGIGATLTYPGPVGDPELNEKIKTAQMGKTARSQKTPARPVVGVNENDMLFITSELVAWLSEDYL